MALILYDQNSGPFYNGSSENIHLPWVSNTSNYLKLAVDTRLSRPPFTHFLLGRPPTHQILRAQLCTCPEWCGLPLRPLWVREVEYGPGGLNLRCMTGMDNLHHGGG